MINQRSLEQLKAHPSNIFISDACNYSACVMLCYLFPFSYFYAYLPPLHFEVFISFLVVCGVWKAVSLARAIAIGQYNEKLQLLASILIFLCQSSSPKLVGLSSLPLLYVV